jgi:glycine/serine hydroxymethyltransferase
MTTRGFGEGEVHVVVDLLDRVVKLALDLQEKSPSRKLVDFTRVAEADPRVKELKAEVEDYCVKYDMP